MAESPGDAAQAAEPQRETESPAAPSGSDTESASLPESRRARYTRHGRRVRLYAGAVVFVALLGVLVVLSTKNTRSVKLDWAVGSAHASLVWIILAAAVIGWLLGLTTAIVFHHRTRRP